MHELALTEGIIDIVNSEARKRNFTKVQKITLKIGEYSGVIPECILEFFPLAAKDTAAQDAEVEIQEIKADFRCLECGHTGLPEKTTHCCTECGSASIKMISGREFYVESLTVE